MTKKAHVLIKKEGLEVRIITSKSEICRIIGIANSTFHIQIKKKGFFENKRFIAKPDVMIETINRNSPNVKIINSLIKEERKRAGKAISKTTGTDVEQYE